MKDLVDNHTNICQRFETLVEFSTKVMHSTETTLYFLQVNKDVKDLGKERENSLSIYGFLVEDWMKTLLDKPIKEEGVTVDKDGPEAKDVEEPDKEGS
jgi:hypothetical protein